MNAPSAFPSMHELAPARHELLNARVNGGFFLLSLGLALAVAFHLHLYAPVQVLALAIALVAAGGLLVARVGPLGLLPRLLIVLYALPFSVLLGYLWSPDYIWMTTPQGIEVIGNHDVVAGMAHVGLVGLLGLIAGILIGGRDADAVEIVPAGREIVPGRRGLDIGVFGALLLVALALTAMGAPPKTIFEAGYGTAEQGSALSARVNFPAAGLISYLLMVVLYIDAEREGNSALARAKMVATIAAAAIIVVYFQLLRGDRESIGLVVAFTGLYLTSPRGMPEASALRDRVRRRVPKVALPAVALVLVFVVMGWARMALSQSGLEIDVGTALALGFQFNTWTAVLWTNLSVAWEYASGLMSYRLGSTYLEYLISLPPGFVTQALGLERPFEAWQGLAWENPLSLSSGGLHVLIAPFRNFGAVGVLGILCLFGVVAARLEKRGPLGSFFLRQLWASVLCASFLWFWYGDMPMIRALIAFLLLYGLYRLLLSVYIFALPNGVPAASGPADLAGGSTTMYRDDRHA